MFFLLVFLEVLVFLWALVFLGALIFLGDRVVAATAPWMASQYPFDSQPKSLERPVLDDGLSRIFGARGCETAGRRRERTDAPLVKEDGGEQDKNQHFLHPSPQPCQHLHNFSPILVSRLLTLLSTATLSWRWSSSHMNATARVLPSGITAAFSYNTCLCLRNASRT